MITIIAGSRLIQDKNLIYSIIDSCEWKITEILSGKARGVDTVAIEYAVSKNIKYKVYPANWNKFGKQAGIIRNCEMAENADALLAIWDGYSRGTGHMIGQAHKMNLKVCVHLV